MSVISKALRGACFLTPQASRLTPRAQRHYHEKRENARKRIRVLDTDNSASSGLICYAERLPQPAFSFAHSAADFAPSRLTPVASSLKRNDQCGKLHASNRPTLARRFLKPHASPPQAQSAATMLRSACSRPTSTFNFQLICNRLGRLSNPNFKRASQRTSFNGHNSCHDRRLWQHPMLPPRSYKKNMSNFRPHRFI